jgi:hypothetical protein
VYKRVQESFNYFGTGFHLIDKSLQEQDLSNAQISAYKSKLDTALRKTEGSCPLMRNNSSDPISFRGKYAMFKIFEEMH